MTRLVLASSSPARLSLLRSAGIEPEVMVPNVDEEQMTKELFEEKPSASAAELVQLLARAKAESVAKDPASSGALVLGGDSALEFEGEIFGKPYKEEIAIKRWQRLSGGEGFLHSGHFLIDNRVQPPKGIGESSATRVKFAKVSESEIAAYVGTGEPFQVAGAFTIDGLGGAFIDSIEGDYHTVVGLSLRVLRRLVQELGEDYTSLWR